MSEWTEESLGRLASIEIGGTPSRDVPAFWASENAEGFPWASIADLGPRFVSATKERITRLGVLSSNVKPVKSGTLMMSFKLTIGRAGIAACDLFTNEAIAAFVPAPQTLDGNFLYYLLPPIARNAVTDVAIKGSTLNKQTLSKLKLRFPKDMRQQRRIAEILTTLDEAIEQTEALIAKHQQIKAGLMHDLFTRGVTPDGHLRPTREQAPDLYKESPLGWISKEWDACPIESLLDRIIDYRGKTPTKTIEGIPLITAKNVRMGYIDPEPREFIAERDYPTWMTRGIPANTDVVFTTEAPLGNVAQIGTSEKVAFAQRVIILQPGARVCPDFLRLLLMAEPFQRSVFRLSSGTTALGVKQSEFRKVMVAYPVLREEQQFISDKLQALEAYEAMEASRMQKHRQQKNGLMHDLLTDCVRVPLAKTKVVSTMAHAPSDLEPNT